MRRLTGGGIARSVRPRTGHAGRATRSRRARRPADRPHISARPAPFTTIRTFATDRRNRHGSRNVMQSSWVVRNRPQLHPWLCGQGGRNWPNGAMSGAWTPWVAMKRTPGGVGMRRCESRLHTAPAGWVRVCSSTLTEGSLIGDPPGEGRAARRTAGGRASDEAPAAPAVLLAAEAAKARAHWQAAAWARARTGGLCLQRSRGVRCRR